MWGCRKAHYEEYNSKEYDEFVCAVMNNDLTKLDDLERSNKQFINKSTFSIGKVFDNLKPGNALPKDNLTLMHIAACFDCLEIFIHLENKYQMNYDIKSADSYLPLHYACNQASVEVASYILSKDPNQAKVIVPNSYQLIFLTASSGDAEILRMILDNGADILDRRNTEKNPIEQAIKGRHVECLKLLLERGTFAKKGDIAKDFTALMCAITNNQPHAVPLLLDCGENPAAVTPRKETALSLACMTRQVDVVRQLCDRLQNVDIDPKVQSAAAVHWICRSYHPEICKMILKKGIDTNRLDEEGRTGPFYMLDVGTEDDVIDILRQLVENGFNLNVRARLSNGKPDLSKNTILGDYVMSIKKFTKVIDWLLNNGADPAELIGNDRVRIIDKMRESKNSKLKDIFHKYLSTHPDQ